MNAPYPYPKDGRMIVFPRAPFTLTLISRVQHLEILIRRWSFLSRSATMIGLVSAQLWPHPAFQVTALACAVTAIAGAINTRQLRGEHRDELEREPVGYAVYTKNPRTGEMMHVGNFAPIDPNVIAFNGGRYYYRAVGGIEYENGVATASVTAPKSTRF